MQSKVKYINRQREIELTPDDLVHMSTKQLRKLKSEILLEVAELKSTLENYDLLQKEGQFVDPVLYQKAKSARYYRGAFLQCIALEESDRSEQRRLENIKQNQAKNETFERYFLDVARESLPHEVFKQLIYATRERAEKNQEDVAA